MFALKREIERVRKSTEDKKVWLEQYRSYIRGQSSAAGPSTIMLTNSPEVTAIVIAEIFRQARTKVMIFSNKIGPEFYLSTEVLEAAEAFVSRDPDARIKILADEVSVDVVSLITGGQHETLLRSIDWCQMPPLSHRECAFRFVVADDDSYWYSKDLNGFCGVAQFHDSEKLGPLLSKIFNDTADG